MPIQSFVCQYGYWAIFVIVGLESAGLPLPGEITLISAAIIAATTGALDIGWVIAVAAAGAIIGDNIGYWVGREFGFALLVRHGRRIGIGERQLKLGQFLFLKHGGKVVFFGRLVAVLRVLAALLAGINRLPWPHFLACNIGGGILWACLFGGGAYIFGQQVQEIAGPAGVLALIASIVGMVVSARYVRGHQRALEDAAERALPGPLVDAGPTAPASEGSADNGNMGFHVGLHDVIDQPIAQLHQDFHVKRRFVEVELPFDLGQPLQQIFVADLMGVESAEAGVLPNGLFGAEMIFPVGGQARQGRSDKVAAGALFHDAAQGVEIGDQFLVPGIDGRVTGQ